MPDFDIFKPRLWTFALIALAAAALLSAFAMQHVGGLHPCKLCIYQRYPYAAMIVIVGGLALIGQSRLALFVSLGLLTLEAGIAYYHWAVELGWVAMPAACAAIAETRDFEAFKAEIMADKARCDEVAGQFLGLSIAAWNAIFATALTVLTAFILLTSRRPQDKAS